MSSDNKLEQPLENMSVCCLGEVIYSNCNSYEEALDVTKLIYRVLKHSLTLDSFSDVTTNTVREHMRMGISADGFMMYNDEQKSWMPKIVEDIRLFDKEYSSKIGVNESKSIFTIKPSGTISLVANVSAGCHPTFAPYYIRRIRFSSSSPILEQCKKAGVDIEPQINFDGSLNYDTLVASFPYKAPDNAQFAKDTTAIKQLEVAAWLQENWSDNAVSVTVYYKPEELDGIKLWLKDNYHRLKCISFLLHSEHGFTQAPLQEITEGEYNEMVSNIDFNILTDSKAFTGIEEVDMSAECSSGICPIR